MRSKYHAGAYHYEDFHNETPTPYRLHVLDLVEKVVKHCIATSPPQPRVIEIGAGEGLILSKIAEQGFMCEGCDTDELAVKLAQIHKNKVHLGSVEIFKDHKEVDVVLLCDVLEHVKDPTMEMAESRRLAHNGIVVIAIPDRFDRHAINSVDTKAVHAAMTAGSFECVHQSQRHARHLMIWRRKIA